MAPRKTKETKEPTQPKITNEFKVSKSKKPKADKKLNKDGKPKRVVNRFNGMSEEEVAKKGLPDYLKEGLDIVFIGINPSMMAAYTGIKYLWLYAHFWKFKKNSKK